MITIIDYRVGNVGSILNMLNKIHADAMVTNEIEKINETDKIILPGVGSFDSGMKNLHEMGLIPVLEKKALEDKVPILGICLGMQLLSENSEEGTMRGLGWLRATTVKFSFGPGQPLKVPHMGWNYVYPRKESRLFNNMYPDPRFYFVHSYYMNPNDSADILTTSNYGIEFTSSVMKENIYGVQFHPEKSHKYGMLLLKNFAENV
jgi:glutamine amidotransferase